MNYVYKVYALSKVCGEKIEKWYISDSEQKARDLFAEVSDAVVITVECVHPTDYPNQGPHPIDVSVTPYSRQ